uniref:Uncharacterized protein n=1 Tax=Nelumbo nucifera TaxID=4432 RepID=A0A822Z6C3_NELNU|nr:TPA_asm: hypothetical protein HUJ06_016237 [Nelumbo nucifera]
MLANHRSNLSADGNMLAYVRDNELHVLDLLYSEPKQLTYGAKENFLVSFIFLVYFCSIWVKEFSNSEFLFTFVYCCFK